MEPSSAAVGTVISTLNASGATKALGDRLSRTFDLLSVKYKLNRFSNFKQNYTQFCHSHLLVKTLSSSGIAVHIDEIYVPLTLRGPQTVEVVDGTALDNVNRISIITGLAGQGKSTLLRKLLSNNIQRFDRLPFFYELKNYRGGAIEHALSNNLEIQGIELSALGFEKLLMDSNVRLYLDAFDECPTQFRHELYQEIKKLVGKYKCSITCTTRPDTELEALIYADNYTVDYLTNEKIKEVIVKTCYDDSKSQALYEALQKSKFHKGNDSVLRSPILVVLFCVSYNLGMCIPETLSQFYKNIFETVFHQHDNLKGFVDRKRHWNDNRLVYKDIFDYFCFITQRAGVNAFDRESYSRFISDALAYLNQDRNIADKIADEISEITNLVIMDGYNEYKFIHKSIQEFYSATFLSKIDTDTKKRFYRKCTADYLLFSSFSNTLSFLEEIDSHAYAEYYLIPGVSDFLELEKCPILDAFKIPFHIMDKFKLAIVFDLTYKTTYDKKLKHPTIETRLGSPFLTNTVPTIEHLTFSKALSFIQRPALNKLHFDEFMKLSTKYDNDTYILSLESYCLVLNISDAEISRCLYLAIEATFRKNYNDALASIENRRSQVARQGYLEF